MPTGPKGQKRPADVIGNAVRVMRSAVGEKADELLDDGKDPAAKALGAKGGKKRGGVASSGCPASPTAAAALARMNAGIDVRGVVAAICAPTLLIHRRNDARSIPTPAASWPGRSRMRGWSKGPGAIIRSGLAMWNGLPT